MQNIKKGNDIYKKVYITATNQANKEVSGCLYLTQSKGSAHNDNSDLGWYVVYDGITELGEATNFALSDDILHTVDTYMVVIQTLDDNVLINLKIQNVDKTAADYKLGDFATPPVIKLNSVTAESLNQSPILHLSSNADSPGDNGNTIRNLHFKKSNFDADSILTIDCLTPINSPSTHYEIQLPGFKLLSTADVNFDKK